MSIIGCENTTQNGCENTIYGQNPPRGWVLFAGFWPIGWVQSPERGLRWGARVSRRYAIWNFTTNLTGESLLSFDVGQGLSDLHAWRYANNTWAAYNTHIVYREGIASFTVSAFNGYAVSAVPEPGTWAIFLGGLLALGLYRLVLASRQGKSFH